MKSNQRLERSSKPWVPHEYQKKAMKFLLTHASAGLLLDPGLGKTSITLGALKMLFKEKRSNGALVICPLRVAYGVWPAEIEKWTQFENLKVVVLHGPQKQAKFQEAADIYVINFDGIEWLTDENRLALLIKRGVDTLVVDELSKFKHTTTQRFKLLKPYLDSFARRWGLTGSPAPNGLLDLFGQAYVLDLGRALGRYITHYRNEFFNPSGYGGYDWKIRPGAADRINERIAPLMLRMAAEDYLELPELMINKILVDLPPKVRAMYDTMEDEAVAQFEGHDKVAAANAAAAMNKCAQIANGGVYYDDITETGSIERAVQELHTEKVDALKELVEELQGAPLLVGYGFQHDITRIQAVLGRNIPYMGGGISPRQADSIVEQWNNDELPVLLGHPASMGHGLNMQEGSCADVCWFGLPYDYEQFDQMIRRVLRQGNKNKRVRVHMIIARGTVDEAKVRALGVKKRTQNTFFEAIKAYRSEK